MAISEVNELLGGDMSPVRAEAVVSPCAICQYFSLPATATEEVAYSDDALKIVGHPLAWVFSNCA